MLCDVGVHARDCDHHDLHDVAPRATGVVYRRGMRIALLVVLAAACGGHHDGSDAGGDVATGVPLGDLTAMRHDAICAEQVACSAMPDTATCDAALQINTTEWETLVGDAMAGTVTYDGNAATACLAYLQGLCTFAGFHVPDPCDAMFDGTLAIGAACNEDEECTGYVAGSATCVATSTTCDRTTTCCPGTCTTATAKGAIGSPCSGSTCGSGLYCSDMTSTCAAIATTAGMSCYGSDGCADPMYCDELSAGAGICTKAAASGDVCEPTATLPCVEDDEYCDVETAMCTPKAMIGHACSTTIPCVSFANCDVTEMCIATPTVGEACFTGTGTACLGDLTCVSTLCTAPADAMTCAP